LIGQTISDRWEILSLIGTGAMGAVYKAKHNTIGRIMAVKTLGAANREDERSVQRFQQEARAMSVLTHPNLIQIADFGMMEDGTPYFVMEYLEGISLQEYVRKNGPMPIELALPVFSQIADALEHAHSKGVIHRDLKPSNVMLTGEKHDFAKVLDLGIAKGEDDLHLTATGEVFGSPLYMSPEQCMGQPVDARSDVYSLGCLMYETLSARPPLKGENFVQTAYKHMNEMPPPLAEVRPEIPADLSQIVEACLAKKPGERVTSMAMLRDMLKEVGQSSPDQSGTVVSQSSANTLREPVQSAADAPPAPPRRKVLPFGIAAILATGLIMAGLFAFTQQRKPPETSPSTATAPNIASVAVPTSSTIDIESPLFKRFDPDAEQEIDVVAVYTAQPPSQLVGKKLENPDTMQVEVFVQPKKEPITLVLFSAMPVHWKVTPRAGATIKKVIASGLYEQIVSSAQGDVSTKCIKLHSYDNPDVEEQRERIFEEVQQGVYQLIGPDADIRNFQGKYYGTQFEI
jgi:eukaryotic-like serine/threonine-protein kinase